VSEDEQIRRFIILTYGEDSVFMFQLLIDELPDFRWPFNEVCLN
jgi:hypothetical protein